MIERGSVGRILIALAAWLVFAACAAEGDLQAVPALKHRVTDQTATLSSADEARIEARLREFEAKKGAQIAVLIVASTQPEDIFTYSQRVFDTWKLGRMGVDDGVLFVVAKDDHKLRIHTGPGISGALTDAMSKRIISEIVSPKFRAGDFAGGIYEGVDKIAAVIDGEALPPPPKKRVSVQHVDYGQFFVLAIFAAVIVAPLLRSILGRFLGATATGTVTGAAAWWIAGGMLFPIFVGVVIFVIALLIGAANLANMGRGGGWGGGWSGGGGGGSWGGSSGGDSFGGGGGGSDGGGASGDW